MFTAPRTEGAEDKKEKLKAVVKDKGKEVKRILNAKTLSTQRKEKIYCRLKAKGERQTLIAPGQTAPRTSKRHEFTLKKTLNAPRTGKRRGQERSQRKPKCRLKEERSNPPVPNGTFGRGWQKQEKELKIPTCPPVC